MLINVLTCGLEFQFWKISSTLVELFSFGGEWGLLPAQKLDSTQIILFPYTGECLALIITLTFVSFPL